MKNTILLSLVILSSLCTACNKNDDSVTPLTCQDVEYSSSFLIEADNKYCFPDDVSLTILGFKNEFCPCDAVCVWEGEMVIDMQWVLTTGDTTTFSFHQGAPSLNDSIPPMLMINTVVEDIVFESDCNNANPSPGIVSTIISVAK